MTTTMDACRMLVALPTRIIARAFTSSPVSCIKAVKDPGMELRERMWQKEFYQKGKGKIYDKKPFKITLKAGKKYIWCACGHSKSQPLCDGTHLNQQLKIPQKPLVFYAPETKEVWLCNCKQSQNPPFCDGTHRSKEIQEVVN